jgi:CRP-like cAMP-binding protein
MIFFRRKYTTEELNLLQFLGNIKLFDKLSDNQKLVFLPYLHLRNYKQNEVVFFRNDPSQALYLIKEGKVNLELDIRERFETIVSLESKASFGHNALLKKTKRIFSAFVVSPLCQIYVLPQVNIFDVFKRKPEMKAQILENLAYIYNQNLENICRIYRENTGFFELKEMFADVVLGI